MSQRNAIQQAFDAFGRASFSEKRSGSWYRRTDEVIAILNLQKSQYSLRYYLNLSFWLREIDAEQLYPKAHQSHIVTRANAVLSPPIGERLDRLLDFDFASSDEVRAAELGEVLTDHLLPLIERGDTVEGLRSLEREGTLEALITVAAQDLMGLGE